MPCLTRAESGTCQVLLPGPGCRPLLTGAGTKCGTIWKQQISGQLCGSALYGSCICCTYYIVNLVNLVSASVEVKVFLVLLISSQSRGSQVSL